MQDSTDQSALEQFRKQWREEVNARSKQGSGKPAKSHVPSTETPQTDRTVNLPPTRHPVADIKDEDHTNESEAEGTSSSVIERIEGLAVRNVDGDDFSARGS